MNKDSHEQQRAYFRLRLNETMRRQIESAAKQSLRSMNAEIVYRLRGTFEQEASAS
jgi:hypothetical protein